MLEHVSVDSEAAGVSAELRRGGDTGPRVASLVHSPCASAPHQDGHVAQTKDRMPVPQFPLL